MNERIEKVQSEIEPLRREIINHPLYKSIRTIADLRIFMEFHIYAVWDFMSLLKALQNNLTCTTIPWFPKGDPETRQLINEIVVGEESDIDLHGNKKSHFELYCDAMEQSGSHVNAINQFVGSLKQTGDFDQAFRTAGTPDEAREFVTFTFDVIHSGKPHVQAAVFTFGREDLIPAMFHAIVSDLNLKFPDSVSLLKYYFERHIEVDGGHHSHLALNMTANLCSNNDAYWEEAEAMTRLSLQKRINLWDGAYKKIISREQ